MRDDLIGKLILTELFFFQVPAVAKKLQKLELKDRLYEKLIQKIYTQVLF